MRNKILRTFFLQDRRIILRGSRSFLALIGFILCSQIQMKAQESLTSTAQNFDDTVHRHHVIVKLKPALAKTIRENLEFAPNTIKTKLKLKSASNEDRLQYWEDRAKLFKSLAQLNGKKAIFPMDFQQTLKNIGVYYLEPASHRQDLKDLFYAYFEKSTFSPVDIARYLESSDGVIYAQPDGLVTFDYNPTDIFYASNQASYMGPLNMPAAWDIATGNGVIIAIVDQAVQIDHPDLAPNIWVNPGDPIDGIDNDGNGIVDDYNGIVDGVPDHGTSVAGVAAAYSAVGSNEGVVGMAFNATIMPVATSLGGSTIVSFSEAIRYAVDEGAHIINNSWHTDPLVAGNSLREAFEYAYQNGVITMNAGGNGGSSASPSGFSCEILPAGYGTGLTIAGVEGGNLSQPVQTYSDGFNIDVAAVGTGQYTTNEGSGYTSFSGTSGATPMTSGLAALLLEVNPSLTVEGIRTILRTTASETGDPGFDEQSGHGLINPLAALQMAQGGAPIPELSLLRPDCENIAGMTSVFIAAQGSGVASVSFYLADSDDLSDFHLVHTQTVNGTISQSSGTPWTSFDANAYLKGSAILKLVMNMQDGSQVIDYGETFITSFQIGNRVWEDVNLSGVYSQGLDIPLADITVELWNPADYPNGQPIATTTTDSDGRYLFDNVSSTATYLVYVPESQPGLQDYKLLPAEPFAWEFLGSDIGNGNPFTVEMVPEIPEAHYADFSFALTDGNDVAVSISIFAIDDDHDLSTTNRIYPPEGSPVYKNGQIFYHINVVNLGTTPVDLKISNFIDPINLVTLNLTPQETPTAYGFDHIIEDLEPYTVSYDPYVRGFTADVLPGFDPQPLCDRVQLLEKNATNPSQYDLVMEDQVCLNYTSPFEVTKELQAVFVGGDFFNEVSNPPMDYAYQGGDWLLYLVTAKNVMPTGNTLNFDLIDELHPNLSLVVSESSPGFDPIAIQNGILIWNETLAGQTEVTKVIMVQVVTDDNAPICNVASVECDGFTAAVSNEMAACVGVQRSVRITEIFPQQAPWAQEVYGIHPWIEITNISGSPVILDGIGLQGPTGTITLSGTLPANNGQYVVCQNKAAFDLEYSGQSATGFDRNCDLEYPGAILDSGTYQLIENGSVIDSVTINPSQLASTHPSSLIVSADHTITPSALAYGTPGYILEIGDANESDSNPYTIPPHGITTFDLILASKHILGTDFIDTIRGWQNMAVASDLCQDEGHGLNILTTLDTIFIRQIILNTIAPCDYAEDYGDIMIGTNLPGIGGEEKGRKTLQAIAGEE